MLRGRDCRTDNHHDIAKVAIMGDISRVTARLCLLA